MKTYVADTVALARYFADSLPAKADQAFEEAEGGGARILVPEVVVGEFVYIALKGRIRSSNPKSVLSQLLDELNDVGYMRQAPMSRAAWEAMIESGIPELHDRMIHSVAVAESADAIITNDKQLRGSSIPTIW